jgi:outer membrane receptor protein involved in Fe transport
VETITSYEIGYSNTFFHKLIFNVNYYKSQLRNFVTNMLPLINPDYGPYSPPSDLPLEIQNVILLTLTQNLSPDLFALMSNSLEDSSAIFAMLSYTNAGRVNTQGVELGFKYFPSKHWKFDFNYTWFDFVVKEELMQDPILPNSPEHRFNLGAAYASKRFDVSMRYRWVDDFPWSSGVYRGHVKSYNLVDLTANIYVGNGFSFGVNISNLLDTRHYQIFGGDILRRNIVAVFSYRW